RNRRLTCFLISKLLIPAADIGRFHVTKRLVSEVRHDVQPHQSGTALPCRRSHLGPLSNPIGRERAQLDLPRLRIDPFVTVDRSFLIRQPLGSLGLGGEGLRRSAINAVRTPVASLPASGGQPTNTAKATAGHQLTAFRWRPERREVDVNGSKVPAWMKSATADAGMRTWRPSRTTVMRRSEIRRRTKRGFVLKTSAACSTVNSLSISGLLPVGFG